MSAKKNKPAVNTSEDPKLSRLVKIRDGMQFSKTNSTTTLRALRRSRALPPFLISSY